MLRAGTTGKLCTWEKACGTEQGRDKGCPMSFRLAKISQQRWAKQGICILLDRAQKCFNMRRCLTILSLPAPYCRVVCHTGVDGFAIHHILDNRQLVMLVRPAAQHEHVCRPDRFLREYPTEFCSRIS